MSGSNGTNLLKLSGNGDEAPALSLDDARAILADRLTLLERACRIIRENLAAAGDMEINSRAPGARIAAPGNMVNVQTPEGPKQLTRGELLEVQAAQLRTQTNGNMADVLRLGAQASELIRGIFEATGVKVL